MKDCYLDIYSRPWAMTKLDTLLGDPTVCEAVRICIAYSFDEDGGWNPGKALKIARSAYRREEAAALFLLLATRFFDIEVAAGRARRAS